jgi:hypothetical protein
MQRQSYREISGVRDLPDTSLFNKTIKETMITTMYLEKVNKVAIWASAAFGADKMPGGGLPAKCGVRNRQRPATGGGVPGKMLRGLKR